MGRAKNAIISESTYFKLDLLVPWIYKVEGATPGALTLPSDVARASPVPATDQLQKKFLLIWGGVHFAQKGEHVRR